MLEKFSFEAFRKKNDKTQGETERSDLTDLAKRAQESFVANDFGAVLESLNQLKEKTLPENERTPDGLSLRELKALFKNDFPGILEIERFTGRKFSENEKKQITNMWSEKIKKQNLTREDLERLKNEGFMVVLRTPKIMHEGRELLATIENLRKKFKGLFYDLSWYNNEKFATDQKNAVRMATSCWSVNSAPVAWVLTTLSGDTRHCTLEVEILCQMDVKVKVSEVEAFLESRSREREMIAEERNGKKVRIGREWTTVFEDNEEKLSWDIVAHQFREQGQTMVDISFMRSDGLEIQPGGEPVEGKVRFGDKDRFMPIEKFKALKNTKENYLEAIKNISSDDKKKKEKARVYLKELHEKHPNSEWVLRVLRYLNGVATKKVTGILGRDPYFVETPHVVKTMEKFIRLMNRQRERGQGVVIIQGDAGTGKNKIVDHLAYLARRPVFRFTCSAGKDEQDLKYLLEYDSKRGTYRIKSTVVEALETPGAILEFDEINTLKPEVAKILNSLFDHDRALFLGEDKEVVRAANEVVLVGLQNPQHYMGVKPLAETIKSRARIMEITYPPFKKEDKTSNEPKQYRSDEAMILRQYVENLKDLDLKDF